MPRAFGAPRFKLYAQSNCHEKTALDNCVFVPAKHVIIQSRHRKRKSNSVTLSLCYLIDSNWIESPQAHKHDVFGLVPDQGRNTTQSKTGISLFPASSVKTVPSQILCFRMVSVIFTDLKSTASQPI